MCGDSHLCCLTSDSRGLLLWRLLQWLRRALYTTKPIREEEIGLTWNFEQKPRVFSNNTNLRAETEVNKNEWRNSGYYLFGSCDSHASSIDLDHVWYHLFAYIRGLVQPSFIIYAGWMAHQEQRPSGNREWGWVGAWYWYWLGLSGTADCQYGQ